MEQKKFRKICYQCLEPSDRIWKDKGTFICPKCYHKRYNSKKFVNQNKPKAPAPTFDDLKRKLEKKNW